MSDQKIKRALLLNSAADSLGLDTHTRKAMTHLEIAIQAMSERGLSWDDVPEDCSFQELLGAGNGRMGKMALTLATKADPGLRFVERAYNHPELRPPLLSAYVNVIEIAAPGETASLATTIKYLQTGEL